jgi:hypothetical protein
MKDIDKGFKEAIKKLQALKGKTLQAGILASAGTNTKTGTLIAEYACYNEFGTKDIPARSFIGATCDEQSKKWEAMIDKMKIDPSCTAEELLGNLGAQIVGDIQDTITYRNILPKLEDPTIKRKKGSTKTLINTRIMCNSINFEIVDK